MICLSLAIENASSGISSVIVDPAAINTLFPTFNGATKLVLHPINTLLPTNEVVLSLSSTIKVNLYQKSIARVAPEMSISR